MDKKRYGVVPLHRLIRKLDRLRQVCRQQGTPDIQDALDAIEPSIDFLFDRSLHDRQAD